MNGAFALVLAGGRGYRLWPKTSYYAPKPFLRVRDHESFLQMTAARAATFLEAGSIYVVTTTDCAHLVRQHLPWMREENLLLEPVARDTAASVAYACVALRRLGEHSVMVMIPSDHYVSDRAAWARTVEDACALARGGRPVLVGVKPTRAESQYGYIVAGQGHRYEGQQTATRFFHVDRFVEKPLSEEASELIRSATCFWNSGMLVCRVDTILGLLEKYLPETSRISAEIGRLREAGGDGPSIRKLFESLSPISLDHAVLEKADGLFVAEGDFGWDDVGGWAALGRLLESDPCGNAVLGDVLLRDCSGCIVDCEGGSAIAVGMKDAVISQHGGKLLCASKAGLGELKDMVRALERGEPGPNPASAQVTVPNVVPKPWGEEIWWAVTDHYLGKTLLISAGCSTSLHLHTVKHETMYCQAGEGKVVLGGEETRFLPGQSLVVPPNTLHRISATTDLAVLEASTPFPVDTVRVEDQYGRGDDLPRAEGKGGSCEF